MRRSALQRLQRYFLILMLIALAGIGLSVSRVMGFGISFWDGVPGQGLVPGLFNRPVAVIVGHAGSDSGAVCADGAGEILLTELEVTQEVAQRVARRLRRAGADVQLLEEFDSDLEGLQADALISVHADSCIEASGFKAAHHADSKIPEAEGAYLACVNATYAAVTDLARHPNTITHDMTGYHAFRRIAPTTPAVILEMGFLGGDRELLTRNPELVAKGIVDSVICFLAPQPEAAQEGS